ncbi:MAG: rhodanese-like domain-containing protein [Ilumatobacteraceae bacterium]
MSTSDITVDDLADRLAEGARLIDVREPDEFDEVRIAASVLVPLRTVPDRVDAFRGDGPVYVMCRSGGRSLQACAYLSGLGVEVVNVEGGILAWIASGRDVVTGPE